MKEPSKTVLISVTVDENGLLEMNERLEAMCCRACQGEALRGTIAYLTHLLRNHDAAAKTQEREPVH